MHRPGIEPRKTTKYEEADVVRSTEGNMAAGAIGKPVAAPPRSETPSMCRIILRGNWEISCLVVARNGSRDPQWQSTRSNPLTYEQEKSDGRIVPEKSANKDRAAARSAERVEGRRPTKGNSLKETKDRTQSRAILQQNLQRVRKAVVKDKERQLNSLWHHVYNVDHLRATFFQMRKAAAPGADGVTWQDYAENLESNLEDLSGRLARGADLSEACSPDLYSKI